MKEKAVKVDKYPDYKTTKSERFSYGVYFLGQIMLYGIVVSFLQLYMTDLGIPAVIVGSVFLIAKIWDAINDPLFGVIVDKANLKGGKYTPWLKISTFAIPVATIFLFAIPSDLSVQVKTIWAAIGYMLWDTAYTMCDVPIFAVATSMTDNQKERDGLFLINRIFMYVGALIGLVLIPSLYPEIGWTMTAVVISVLSLITMIPISFKAKERYFTHREKEPSISDLFKYLGRNKYLLIFNGVLIVASLTSTAGVVGNYVAIHCYGGVEWITYFGLIAALPVFISIAVMQKLIKKIDKYKIYVFCSAASIVLSIITYFVGYSNMTPLIILGIIKSLLTGGVGILGVMFTADCAEYGHFVSGDRAQGMAFSVQTFTAKITTALASAVGMFILAAVGFVEGEGAAQTAQTIDWLWRMNTLIPNISATVALVLLIIFYRLRTKDAALMLKANVGEITRDEAEAQFTRKY